MREEPLSALASSVMTIRSHRSAKADRSPDASVSCEWPPSRAPVVGPSDAHRPPGASLRHQQDHRDDGLCHWQNRGETVGLVGLPSYVAA